MKELFNNNISNYKNPLSKTNYINLDNAATTPPFKYVESNVLKDLYEYGSVHRGSGIKSRISTKKYEEVRIAIKSFVNANPSDYVVFVPNTTSGINQLAYFFAQIKGKVLLSDIEHSSSLLPWIFYEGRKMNSQQVSLEDALKNNTDILNKQIVDAGRKKIEIFKTKDDFSYDIKSIELKLKENFNDDENRIKLIVLVGSSNVSGYKPPLKKISSIAHRYGAMVLVDACQLLQHDKIDMIKQGVDFVVFSGHKMYAPFGGGAIVGNYKIFDAFWPYQMGGGNFPYISKKGRVYRYKTEQAHDPGTPNYIGARSLLSAIQQIEKIGIQHIKTHEKKLMNLVFNELNNIKNISIYTHNKDTSLITFNIEKFPSYLLSEILNDEYGIGTRAGSYCVYEFTRRIMNIKNDEYIAKQVNLGDTSLIPGCVRASFGIGNDLEDAKYFVNAIIEIASKGVNYYISKYRKINNSAEYRKI